MKPTLEIIAILISISTFLGGLVMWYSGAVRKRYASQRDFEHLKASYNQLASNQAAILKELDTRFDATMLELKEHKGLLVAVLGQTLGKKGDDSQSFYFKNRDN